MNAVTFCPESKLECRANYNNMCLALDDANFNKPCPFFKTYKQWITELLDLQAKGHNIEHLIDNDEEEEI